MSGYFETILMGDKKYGLNSFNGESVLFNITGGGTTDDNISYDFNLEGPDGVWIPGWGSYNYEIGLAIDGGDGHDTIAGYDEPDWLCGNRATTSWMAARATIPMSSRMRPTS